MRTKTLYKDWYGKACPKVSFQIDKETDWIFKVDVQQSPEKNLLAKSGQYYEGLWEQNVAEWFIVNPKTGRYVECNLAANGAWWMMLFTAPRVRAKSSTFADVKTRSTLSENSWQAELSIPEKLLTDMLGQADWTFNVCFIVGQLPKQYISLNQLSSKSPDFHRPHEITTVLPSIVNPPAIN